MMIEDKLKATDWEATDVAVAEQVRTHFLVQMLLNYSCWTNDAFATDLKKLSVTKEACFN